MAGVLLPIANILQALSDSGAVLSGGKIHTYIQGTTTNQLTYKQQALSGQHTNPIVLNSAGRLDDPVWAAAGTVFKLVFTTSAGTQIGPTWDNVRGLNDTSALGVTYFGGTSGGSANAQTLTISDGPSDYAQGNEFLFKAGNTNTGAATINVNSLGAKTFKKEDENDLVGGEIIANRWYRAIYDGTYMLLEALDNQEANRVDVASATTVDLDAADSGYVRITGSTGPIGTITLSNGRECEVVFASTPTLTNSASLILPSSLDIVAAAGDTARFRGEASSVVRCVSYTRASGQAIIPAVGSFRVIGADCKNNSGTPDTQYDLDCDAVILRNSSDQIVVRWSPGAALTNNVSTAGSTANGRDQAGAFSAGSWVHFYWIWNGTTLATLSSATAPPTGPTLPSGYTHWAYAGAVRFSAGSALLKTRIKGSRAFYEAAQVALNGGTSTSEATVDVSSLAPPNALSYTIVVHYKQDAATAFSLSLLLVTGTTWDQVFAKDGQRTNVTYEVPNIGQAFIYSISASATSPDGDIDLLGYKLPNGGE